MSQILVTKRDGRKEPLNLEKLHKVVFWATKDITGVSASELEINSHVQFYNGIKTSDIQETLIKSAADLISEDTPNYQYVAGRLLVYHIYKQDILHFSKTNCEEQNDQIHARNAEYAKLHHLH